MALRGPGPRLGGSTFALVVAVALPAIVLAGMIGSAAGAAATYPPLTGKITGSNVVGEGLIQNYNVTGTGGPAYGLNGTEIGTLSYEASVTGTNTTGVLISPSAGVLTNGSALLQLTANNITQSIVITVALTSGYNGTNVTTNLTYSVQIVQPYTLHAQLDVESALGTQPFNLTVLLDGRPVGQVAIPTLTGHSTYAVVFSYVDQSLGPGTHTFSISLANQHGLVLFSNGATVYSQSFYVAGPPTNFTAWYLVGGATCVAAIFIFLTASGARRRGRKR